MLDKKINQILKGKITMYGYKCPNCGANLDPEEKCDCSNNQEINEEKESE